jgi:hypothetical protein
MPPPQPRVDRGIGEVDEEGHEDHGEDQQHHHASTTIRSRWVIAWKISRPSPGRKNTFSMMIAPASRKEKLQPDDRQHRDQRVAEGVAPQRLRAVSPLARAVRM